MFDIWASYVYDTITYLLYPFDEHDYHEALFDLTFTLLSVLCSVRYHEASRLHRRNFFPLWLHFEL